MVEKFDAIVVGAGPAGSAAAMELARNGARTLVLERGKFPGHKNVTGGILYGQDNTPYNLDYLVPDFEKRAPLERPIHRYLMHCLYNNRVKTLDITRLHGHHTKWSYAVLRVPFDRWFASEVHKEARKSGGGVVSEVRVTGPLVEDGRITGVVTNELEPIRADVVVAADGATSELARNSGIRSWWSEPEWFQGVKVVVKMPKDAVEERFDLDGEADGSAHLFAGNVFEGVRGGGFLYTNKESLSIGTVFHLDSIAANGTPPHKLLDRLLAHPLLRNWLGAYYDETEYSAKLIPDGKKCVLERPWKDNLLVAGDAAGHMKAAGPIIKGMNLGITAGILAARAYLEARKTGNLPQVGPIYERMLGDSIVGEEFAPPRGFMARMARSPTMNARLEAFLRSDMGRLFLRSRMGQKRLTKMLSDYNLASAAPDTEFTYVTLPSLVAKEAGEPVRSHAEIRLRTLDERIAALGYDTDIGTAHIEVLDDTPAASGKTVFTCPVSSPESSRGCYRLENAVLSDGKVRRQVVLDVQPCIECGTCAVEGVVRWEHPNGGKGVGYQYG
ncbi:MAG TPA: FAD-dependent oxidoreductase [Candidatus Thermoplasmatota archaeon]|nr:FAD-dependent oxidoreductase [Candidatus Thermoplasmatota archaeon]